MTRMGTEIRHSIAYNSQARGMIERVHQTIWIRLAKKLPTYMEADMDSQARQAKQLAVYQLLHNTGPKAPEIQRGKKVYDGNLGMIVYDPEKPLPPSHEAEKNNSEQAKKAKKGGRYDRG